MPVFMFEYVFNYIKKHVIKEMQSSPVHYRRGGGVAINKQRVFLNMFPEKKKISLVSESMCLLNWGGRGLIPC